MSEPTEPRVELRYWLDDGSCYEVVFGPTVTIDIIQSLAASDEPNNRGWFLAKEPIEPSGPQRVEMSGVERVVKHSPGYLTPEQRRIRELEDDVERLEQRLERSEQGHLA